MRTYMDRESTEATDFIQSSSCIRIIWITPKSREHNKDIWSIVKLRFGPLAMPLYSLMDLFEGQ